MRRILSTVDQNIKRARVPPPPLGQRLLQILAVEIKNAARARAIKDAAHRELILAREDVSHQRNAVTQMKIELGGEVAADDARSPLAFEGALLILGDSQLAENHEQFFRLHGKA